MLIDLESFMCLFVGLIREWIRVIYPFFFILDISEIWSYFIFFFWKKIILENTFSKFFNNIIIPHISIICDKMQRIWTFFSWNILNANIYNNDKWVFLICKFIWYSSESSFFLISFFYIQKKNFFLGNSMNC